MKKIILSPNAPKPIGPYSQAVKTNNMLFISGQVPINPATGEVVKGSIKEQTQQVMKNTIAILKEAGLSINDVVKTTIFTTDISKFSEINDVYTSYFTSHFPARETVEVSKLPLLVDVEISMIAIGN